MKLNAKRLRSLIENTLRESSPNYNKLSKLRALFVQDVEDEWMRIAEGDPSLEHEGAVKGFDNWTVQVGLAADELDEHLGALLDDIENKLINGEYYKGQ